MATNLGAGSIYKLKVVEDVTLEEPSRNYDYLEYLLVGLHTGYLKKRSLLKFEDIPRGDGPINYAMMYLYYQYSHKASFYSVYQAPHISRTVQAHRVLKSWRETEATSSKRDHRSLWGTPWLGLDDIDAKSEPTGQSTIRASRPSGFVEIDITSAVREWNAGFPNYGLLIWATNEDQEGRDIRFASKSDTDSSKHPYMVLNCFSTETNVAQ